MQRIRILTVFLLFATLVFAQAPSWNVNPGEFDQTAALTAELVVNGSVSNNPNDIIAAMIDGQVRGVANPPSSANPFGKYAFAMTIYSDASSSSEISFKVYLADYDVIVDANETLTFSNNGIWGNAMTPEQITTSYTPTAPEIDVQRPGGTSISDGGSDAVGNKAVGSVSLTYTIDNSAGTDVLTVSSITSANHVNSSNFSVVTSLPLNVAAGGSETVEVSFDVDAAAAFSFDMDINNNDSDENPYDIAVSGTGEGDPEIAVERPGGTAIADGGSDAVGNKAVGSVSLTYTIDNSAGTDVLTVSSISSANHVNSSNFSAVTSLPLNVAAGGSETVEVSFDVDAAAAFSFDMDINNNDSDENPYDIAVSGTGTGDPEIAVERPSGTAIADGGSDAVGNKAVGSVSLTYTIDNSAGTDVLTVSSITSANHVNSSNFSVVTSLPLNVAAGGSETVEVSFDVALDGAFSFDMDINNNDADENPYDIAVSGTGEGDPEIAVERPAGTAIADGGSDAVGSRSVGAVTLTYKIDNSAGTDVLTVSSITSANHTNSSNFSAVTSLPLNVAAGGSEDVQVSFDVDAEGAFLFDMDINNNDADENPYDIAVSGTGQGTPEIVVQRPAGSAIADGGSDAIGSHLVGSVNLTYTIDNSAGTGVLTVSDLTAANMVNSSNFSVDTGLPLNVAAGGTDSVKISFDIDAAGAFSLDLDFINNDADKTPYDVALSGTGIEPLFSFDPASPKDFGNVDVGTSSSEFTLRAKNPGSAALTLGTVTFSGPNADQFSVNWLNTTNETIPANDPGYDCQLARLTFSPSDTGTAVAYVIVPSDAKSSPDSFKVTGRGTPPPVAVISVDPDSGNFGSVLLNAATWPTEVFDIGNSGNDDLVLSAFDIVNASSGAFSLHAGDLTSGSKTIQPGDPVHQLTIQFAPGSAGDHTADLKITSNTGGVQDTAIYIPLTGKGEEPVPDIAVTPDSLEFGHLFVGEDSTRSLTVKNEGTDTLRISSLPITGAASADFSLLNGGAFNLAPNKDKVLNIKFTPQDGDRSAVLTINSNDADTPALQVPLHGSAEVPTPGFAIDPTSGDFGLVLIGSEKSITFTITNDGTAPTTLKGIVKQADTTKFSIVSGGIANLADSVVLAPNEDYDLVVKFSPLTISEQASQITITHTADGSPYTLDLTGKGTFEQPVIDFDATPTLGYPGMVVKFSNKSKSSIEITGYEWDFGDGQTSTQPNPEIGFYKPGRYTITLTAKTDFGDFVKQKFHFIHVFGSEYFDSSLLTLVDNSPAHVEQSWNNAIDNDISGWDGTVTATGDDAWAIFKFRNDKEQMVSAVKLLTDTGVGWDKRWVWEFQIWVSTSGTNPSDFSQVLAANKTTGDWETFTLDTPVAAKYIKLVCTQPNNQIKQIGEFHVCTDQKKLSAEQSQMSIVKAHAEANGVDAAQVDLTLKAEDGSLIDDYTDDNFYFMNYLGMQVSSEVINKGNGVYQVNFVSLSSGECPISMFVNGLLVAKPTLTFTQADLEKAALIIVDSKGAVDADESWEKSIDGNDTGWDCRTTIYPNHGYAVYGFADGLMHSMQKVALVSDAGIGFPERFVGRFTILVSTTGTNAADFTPVYSGIQRDGSWQSHMLPLTPVKYLKFVVDFPVSGLAQIAEFDVYLNDKVSAAELLSKVADSQKPLEFDLGYNYPNPFNPTTTIQYQIKESCHVSLQIFNIAGEQVAELVDSNQQPGQYQVQFDALNLPSGVYFYQLQAGSFTDLKRMMLIK